MKLIITEKELLAYYCLIALIFLTFSSWYIGEKIGRLLYHVLPF